MISQKLCSIMIIQNIVRFVNNFLKKILGQLGAVPKCANETFWDCP